MKYKPEYCQLLIDHMSKGYSFSTFAANINTGQGTLLDWIKRYPEFAEAKDTGEQASKRFWETLLVVKGSGQRTTKLNPKDMDTTAIIFATKTRFRDTYGENVKVEIAQGDQIVKELNNFQLESIKALAQELIEAKKD